MFECERLLGVARSFEIRRFIEDQTDAPCPCKVGAMCPLGLLPPAPARQFVKWISDRLDGPSQERSWSA